MQQERLVVQVPGYGPGAEGWLVDRFDIRWSTRLYCDEALPVDLASRPEDWALLTERVVRVSYPLQGARNRLLSRICGGFFRSRSRGTTRIDRNFRNPGSDRPFGNCSLRCSISCILSVVPLAGGRSGWGSRRSDDTKCPNRVVDNRKRTDALPYGV